jgi:hypothetical protein
VHAQLTNHSDSDATVKLWTQLFGWVLPLGGVLSIPVVGYFLDGKVWLLLAFLFLPCRAQRVLSLQGMRISLWVLNLAATAFGGFTIIPNLYAQMGSFVTMAFFRAFIFSAMANYIVEMFGFANL